MKKLLLGVFFLFAATANAYNVIYNDAGHVTAIGNLDISGTFYNVDFEAQTYSTFGGVEAFWTNLAAAGIASTAINTVLNAEGPSTLVNNDVADFYTVVVASTGGTVLNSKASSLVGYWGCHWENCGYDFFPPPASIRTSWSLAAVPVPPALWLFGSALAGLGWLRRKPVA